MFLVGTSLLSRRAYGCATVSEEWIIGSAMQIRTQRWEQKRGWTDGVVALAAAIRRVRPSLPSY